MKLCVACGLAIAALTVIMAAGCNKQLKLPLDPGLASDGLGLGVYLGQSTADARTKASATAGVADVWVMTREELNRHSPYTERSGDLDLMIALYSEDPGDGSPALTPLGYGAIDELRCYLANSEKSAVQVLGERAVLFQPQSVQDKLGKPFLSPEVASDGQVHLTYYFAYPQQQDKPRQKSQWAIKLVVSFAATGGCYAVALSVVEPPQH